VKNEHVTLAQELHDGIAQDLVGLGFSIDNAISHSKDPETRKELRAIRFVISEQTEKVRVEIHRLRSLSPNQTRSTPDFSYQLSQIFNEILRNVLQHSKATSLSITIADNGIGGATEKVDSFGLLGIKERVHFLRGETLIESDQNGTKIAIHIPLDKNDTSTNSR
jgi:NarL family two-component system sensor histidine kinase LiaS